MGHVCQQAYFLMQEMAMSHKEQQKEEQSEWEKKTVEMC